MTATFSSFRACRHGRCALWSALSLGASLLAGAVRPVGAQVAWTGYGNGPQHTAQASTAARPLERIFWKTPVDFAPQYISWDNNALLTHYGSISITRSNIVLVPVKTGANGGFQVEAHQGANGALLWTVPSHYQLPPHGWTPSCSGVLTDDNTYYFPDTGGTLLKITNLASNAPTVTRMAFYGIANYNGAHVAYDSGVFINTPLSADRNGNLYFGFEVLANATIPLHSGLARFATDGTGISASAFDLTHGADSKVQHNCAPAFSNDGTIVFVVTNRGDGTGFSAGTLLALDSKTLNLLAAVRPKDVSATSNDVLMPDDGTATPMVGPDGDIYMGSLDGTFSNHDHGWLYHYALAFNKTTSSYSFAPKTPGGFGWDLTPSVVPASLIPSYKGKSSYLLLTKYNNYGEAAGDGHNRVAILDPNDTQTNPINGTTVMKEVQTVLGATPDSNFPNLPGAVREWCINTAVVDRYTKSALINSEDGKLYRWDLPSNTLTQVVTLTAGIGEAYTPTVVGPDGTTYAINNATLFAVNNLKAQTLTPVADATVQAGTFANQNFGGASTLAVRAVSDPASSSNSIAYVKLDLSHFGTSPTSAMLKLPVLAGSQGSQKVTVKIYSVSGDWTEGNITWNNAPGLNPATATSTGTLIGSKTLTTVAGFVTIDLTGFVNANLGKMVTLQFVGTPTDVTGVSFKSKEGGATNSLQIQY